MVYICTCLADNEALRTLDLSWNQVRKKGAVAVATSLKICASHLTICMWLDLQKWVLYMHLIFHLSYGTVQRKGSECIAIINQLRTNLPFVEVHEAMHSI